MKHVNLRRFLYVTIPLSLLCALYIYIQAGANEHDLSFAFNRGKEHTSSPDILFIAGFVIEAVQSIFLGA